MIQPSRQPAVPESLNRLTVALIAVFAVALRAAGFAWTTSLLAAVGLGTLTFVGFFAVYRIGVRAEVRRRRERR